MTWAAAGCWPTAHLRSSDRRRRAALHDPGARIRPGTVLRPAPGHVPVGLHHPQRHGTRSLAADPPLPRQVGNGHQRQGQYRGAGHLLLRLPAPRLRPPRHRPAAGNARSRVRRAGLGDPRLLAAMPDGPDFYFDSVSQIRMDNWSADRVALVGDAGYCPSPLSGQGTSLAIVGAYVLAGALQEAGRDHGAAFAAYQRRMRDFVARNQQIAIGNTKRFIPQTPPADLAAEPGPQDTALPRRQETRPQPGHQGRPGGSQRHRAGRKPRLISGPAAAAIVTARRFAGQAAGQQRKPASPDPPRGRSQTMTKTAAPAPMRCPGRPLIRRAAGAGARGVITWACVVS